MTASSSGVGRQLCRPPKQLVTTVGIIFQHLVLYRYATLDKSGHGRSLSGPRELSPPPHEPFQSSFDASILAPPALDPINSLWKIASHA